MIPYNTGWYKSTTLEPWEISYRNQATCKQETDLGNSSGEETQNNFSSESSVDAPLPWALQTEGHGLDEEETQLLIDIPVEYCEDEL